MNSRKKYWNYLYLLVTVFFLCLIIVFPKMPVKFSIWGKNVDMVLESPEINTMFLGKQVYKELKPIFGLEMGGGYRLALKTDMESVEASERDSKLTEVRKDLNNRAYRVGLSDFQITEEIKDGFYYINFEVGSNEDFDKVFLISTTGNLSFKQLSEEFKDSEDTTVLYDPASYTETELNDSDFEIAEVIANSVTGEPAIQLIFTEDGLYKFGEIAKSNVGYPIAIMIDNSIISAPTISEDFILNEITNPVISGGFSRDYAGSLTSLINSGALSVPIEVENTEAIEAFWNKDVVNKSLLAIIFGLLTSSVFVFIKYRKLGFIFVLTLIYNFALSVAFVEFGFPTVVSWLFSGVMGELFFEPLIITTFSLLGLLVSNLVLVKTLIVLFNSLGNIKSNITTELINKTFLDSTKRMAPVWTIIFIVSVLLGWFGLGSLSEAGSALGLFGVICLVTIHSFTRVLVHLFYKSK